MYLLVTPDGARYWRMDYRFAGKRRTLALGVYPIYRFRMHAHVVKKREGPSLRTLIPALQRRRESEPQKLPAKTRSRP